MERAHRDDVQLAPALEDVETKTEQPTRERFPAGEAPQVGDTEQQALPKTASQLAFDDDHSMRDLKNHVRDYVGRAFGGSYKKAFDHYGARDGRVDKDELMALLSDAGVGTMFTRAEWAKTLLAKLDGDKDHEIAWGEFQGVIRRDDDY